MPAPRFSRRPLFRPLLFVAALVCSAITCTDVTSPGSHGRIVVGMAPSFSRSAISAYHQLPLFDVSVTNVHVRLLHADGSVAVDTTVAFGKDSVTLELSVTLAGASEQLGADVELRDGTTVLFSGHQTIEAHAGVVASTPAPVTLNYSGPGADATSLSVAPADSFVRSTDKLQLRATATNQAGQPVSNLLLAWSVSDASLGDVDANGLFTPKGPRGTTWVIAALPTGLRDSTKLTVAPVPTQIVIVSGGVQTGVAGSALPQPVVFETRAADNLPVPGVAIDYSVSGGGSVPAASATTDVNGQASVILTLGKTAGANSLSATFGTATPAVATATGTAGAATAATSTANVPGGVAGTPTVISLQARDANGNARTTTSGVAAGTVTGANAGATVTVTDNNDGTYTLSYTPTAVGADQVAITLGGQPVGSSPFATTVIAGALHHFLVEAQAGGAIGPQTAGSSFAIRLPAKDANDNTATSFTGPTATVALSSAGGISPAGTTAGFSNGVLSLPSVVISTAGSFTISATQSGGAITGVSNSFVVAAGAAVAAPSVATVPPSGTSGSPTSMMVQTRDANGNARTTACACAVAATVTGANAGTTVAVTDNANGTYSLSYVPMIAGSDQIAVTLDGQPVGGSPFTTVVGPAALMHFAVEAGAGGPIGLQTAGAPFSIRVTAKDAAGNTVTSFNGSSSTITLASAGTMNPSGPISIPFTSGVMTVTVILTPAGTFDITATETGGSASGTSNSFVVAAGAISASSSQATVPSGVAGHPTNVALQTRDAIGNNRTSSCGCTVAASVSGANSGATVTVTDNTDGTYLLSYTPMASGSDAITITIDGQVITGSPFGSSVAAGALQHFLVESAAGGSIGPQTAGVAFAIRLTAKDANGNTVTGFSGTADVSSTGAMSPTGTTAAFVSGVLSSASVTISNTGSFTIAAVRTGGTQGGTSAPFAVAPGPVAAATSTATVPSGTAGVQTTVTLHTRDAFGNLRVSACNCTTAGTVSGANSANMAVNDNGDGTYTLTYAPANTGSDQIAITLDGEAVSGSPYTSAVSAGALDHFVIVKDATGGPIGTITADTVTLRITAMDATNHPITNYDGSQFPVLIKLGATAVSGASVFTNGVATALTPLFTAGSYSLTAAQVNGSITGSLPVTINPAAPNHLEFVAAPAGAVAGTVMPTFTVAVKDLYSNTITTDNSTMISISNAGGVVDYPYPNGVRTATVSGGVATFSQVRLRYAATYAFLASDGASLAGASTTFTIDPGPVSFFEVSGIPSPRTQNSPFAIDIVARDSIGNKAAGFTGTVDITASSGNLAGDKITTPPFVAGQLTGQSVTFTNTGSAQIQVMRTGGTETGSTNEFTLNAPVLFAEIAPTMYGSSVSHACGIDTSGQTYCWGNSAQGALGKDEPIGTPCVTEYTVETCTPIAVSGPPALHSIVSGEAYSCGLSAGNVAWCWGSGQGSLVSNGTPTALESRNFSMLTAGHHTTCGIDATTQLGYCWGYNGYGNIGDGTINSATSPSPVSGEIQFATLLASQSNTCGISKSGDMWCWGDNQSKQLGKATFESSYSAVPVLVDGGRGWSALGVGQSHACAIEASTNDAYCWGANGSGQVGDGSNTQRSSPTLVKGGLKVSQITGGAAHTCAITTEGTAYCWGSNSSGQLGNNSPSETLALEPVAVLGGLKFSSIKAGDYYTCGLTIDGAIYCWGRNDQGQLGDGSRKDTQVPIQIAPPEQIAR
jgi:alpha-tubulin suppressor-like RCC1 family protein